MVIGTDPELLTFAAQLLEERGGIVERDQESLSALIPDSLSSSLELPDEVLLGAGGESLQYGSPLVERLVHLATNEPQVVYGNLSIAYIKKDGFDRLLEEDFSFFNSKATVTHRSERRASYMIAGCHYSAQSDEIKEGMIELALNEETGTMVSEMGERWKDFQVEFYPSGRAPSVFPSLSADTIACALKSARPLVEAQTASFLSALRRHLRRDIQNTQEYYKAMEWEMRNDLQTRKLSDDQQKERELKIQGLPGEMRRKIEDLQAKYRVRLTLTARFAVRVLVPVAGITVEIRHRKICKETHLTYNPVTRRIDPVRCQHCGASTKRVFPRDVQERIALYCAQCAEQA